MKNLFLKFAMLCFVLSPAMLVSCSDDDNGGDGGDGCAYVCRCSRDYRADDAC